MLIDFNERIETIRSEIEKFIRKDELTNKEIKMVISDDSILEQETLEDESLEQNSIEKNIAINIQNDSSSNKDKIIESSKEQNHECYGMKALKYRTIQYKKQKSKGKYEESDEPDGIEDSSKIIENNLEIEINIYSKPWKKLRTNEKQNRLIVFLNKERVSNKWSIEKYNEIKYYLSSKMPKEADIVYDEEVGCIKEIQFNSKMFPTENIFEKLFG